MFALFSGLIGTAFSVLIRLELSGPGVQYIADNQFYNSVITAHAIVMIAPMRFVPRKSHEEIMDNLCHVKSIEAGMVKPYGETQTAKLYVKGLNGQTVESLGFRPDLSYMEIRLTNLIHMVSHNRTLPSLNSIGGWVVPWNDIMSVPAKVNVLPDNTQSVNKICKYEHITFRNGELRDHLRGPVMVPNNYSTIKLRNRMGPLFRPISQGGDGVVIVCPVSLGKRTTGFKRGAKYSSKADQIKMVTRGSEENLTPANDCVNKVSIKNIANLKNLVAAYKLIKSKPGNMSAATDTLEGINIEYLTRLQSRLRGGSYEFPPARRIQTPKARKNETPPLTIASPRDKIVHKAIQLVMEPLYEKQFLDTSHGFRPNRGTRTAIEYLKAKFQNVHYIIEADFSKTFDTIPHKKLMEIISREINCDKTLKLINYGIKAGGIEFGKLHQNLAYGTPQDSILSPLLCNIYFHELDIFVENIKQEYNYGTKRGTSKEYEKLANRVSYMRKKGLYTSNKDEYLYIMGKKLNTPSKKQDDSYIRIHYVRYADDFIIGVEGSYQIAKTILEKMRTFISSSLSLNLNNTKTGITKYSQKRVKFLGYKISAPYFKPLETIRPENSDKTTISKKIGIRIDMDTEKVLKGLETNRFIRKRNAVSGGKSLEYRGTFKGNLINIDHADILKYYNSVIRGVYNYYKFVNNTQDLAHVIRRLTESCALTLARKFNMRTMRLAYLNFGEDLGCVIKLKGGKEKRISIFKPANFKKKHIYKTVKTDKDPFKTIESS
jgi:group II intron reverse transcriptase/maturase